MWQIIIYNIIILILLYSISHDKNKHNTTQNLYFVDEWIFCQVWINLFAGSTTDMYAVFSSNW